MTKKQKILSIISSIILAIFLVVAYLVGDYFTEYSIGRRPTNEDDPLSPTYTKAQTEKDNEALAQEKEMVFHATASTQEVYMTSFDEKEELYAKIFTQNTDSDLWAVVVHGYTSDHTSIQDIAAEFFNKGYNVITPDLRAHNNSTGEYIAMGGLDSKDIISWCEYIIDINSDAKIVLHGSSMGGATVMMAAGDETLPENVKVIIEDSGYTSAYQMFKEQIEYRFNIPAFPALDISLFVAQIKSGYNLKDVNPIEALETATLPILFMHGDEDGFVLPYMIDELYNSYTGPKEKLITQGADHTAARDVDPETYYNTIFDFIKKHMQ